MTITNGSKISSNDLLTMNDESITNLQTANLPPPTQINYNLNFSNVISTTSSRNRTSHIVIPDDMIVAEIACSSANTLGRITVTIDNSAMIVPVSVTWIGLSALTKAPRYYGTGSTATGNPLQMLLKFSTADITVSNTATSGSNLIFVTLCLESRFRRI